MLKLLDVDSQFFSDEQVVTILDSATSEGFVKKAADVRVSDFVSGIKSDPNKIYVHILAMGAGEYYGANRNGDYFPEENLKKYHDTFVTSPAHIFKHHVNKDPTIAIGQVVFSVYNERMHRVEVIAWIDRDKGWDVVQKIEGGNFPNTSMACHTPYDTCSICGNQARSRAAYCTHLTNELGKVYPDGRKVMAINDGFLKFFDMSIVFRPADVTSSVLQKVAFERGVVGSAENAEANSLQEKKANLKKLSELIKEIEGSVVASSPNLDSLLASVQDPDHEVIDLLVDYDLHHVIHALSELGISPSLDFFAKLIGQKMAGKGQGGVDGIETLVRGLIRSEPENLNIPSADLSKNAELNKASWKDPTLRKLLIPFSKQASLFPSEVFGRAVGPRGNIGYAGSGPKVEVDPHEEAKAIYANLKANSEPGLLKTLFLIGGAAVAAKWILTKLIEQKMYEHRVDPNSHTKITLVKSAEEAIMTKNLAFTVLLKDLTL